MESSAMYAVDPFAPSSGGGAFRRLLSAVLATAVFRCWPLLLFFSGWAVAVTVISHSVHSLAISPTLLTVIGTVLGFVVSYRTTASFERYNEGRRLWSQIVLGSRTLARTIWFHVPETMPSAKDDPSTLEQRKARVLIEKKTVINLIEAFGVAVKHYLRGEEGVYYVDLYHLVKYLPSYALPPGMPSLVDVTSATSDGASTHSPLRHRGDSSAPYPSDLEHATTDLPPPSPVNATHQTGTLPFPATSPRKVSVQADLPMPRLQLNGRSRTIDEKQSRSFDEKDKASTYSGRAGGDTADFLLPARMPPKYHLLDLFPFSLLVGYLTKRGKEVKGKKAARVRAKLRSRTVTHNLPLEISLYLSSYIAALQDRGAVPPPTATNLLNALNQLVDALTGLERILTTPIPFSYRVHLWTVAVLYCLLLPFQIWATFKWLTIPATALASFIFFGFLVAGEEIENPFGYDKNDLNLDHFTHNIIRNELRAITALPAPHVESWAFSSFNDQIFTKDERVTPDEWMQRGVGPIRSALATM
ncbi:Bestrophin, RFP-TM, chloride channel-domain-containing protein [Dichomitus squalens]|uniref:Bestrophin, RFP-TM, chloride channel-domain-containing protein n=1 Tax=Dichomitus squalens TaxID=114155 RepID=A0A4Q9MW23_9APHY|nr:Bestrophin, RFP-TM, chloride channel-domain-containing protein [Dichomitus squalens]TBU58301.1 Bestrophin, RFP-TM, chloride channel-domain-containing protein [Dichomitus squalens]